MNACDLPSSSLCLQTSEYGVERGLLLNSSLKSSIIKTLLPIDSE